MKINIQHLASAIVLIFFFFIAFGSDDDNSEKTDEPSETEKIQENASLTQAQKDSLMVIEIAKEIKVRENQTVSSRSLAVAYANNEVSADNDYKNKTFYVEGKIDDIGKDVLDDIYVTLKGSSKGFSNVQCYIDNSDIIANLKKGQFITVKGTCDGLMMNVLMKNCVVVENLSDLKKK